jgi:Tol biopolymer transport system component
LSWSPDGRRLAFTKTERNANVFHGSIEICDLNGANRTVVVSSPEGLLTNLCWLRDGQIVYSQEEPDSYDENLWRVPVDGRTGMPSGKPKRITQWAGSLIVALDASVDGKRLVFMKMISQPQIYVTELSGGGTRINPPRRLANAETNDVPTAWMPDSKAVLFESDRNGKWSIFKQGISEAAAEPILTGQEAFHNPRVSPNGDWILYAETPKGAGRSTPDRLMRIPINGGAPQFVLEMRNDAVYQCARAPASLCVIFEDSEDEKQITLTAFDPLKGRGKVLRTMQKEPRVYFALALSPDGSTVAIAKEHEPDIHIRLLSLSGASDREIALKGWPNIAGLDWSSDGKELYCGSMDNQGELLYVDLKGNAKLLWQHKILTGPWFGGIPSPDGRYLAIPGRIANSNVWMLENF